MLPATNISVKDRIHFLYKFMQHPFKIGSITPSSNYLAKKIFSAIDWNDINVIVELGAGTGVFTHTIYEQKNLNCRAYIFEKDHDMRLALMLAYPSLIFASEAEKMDQLLDEAGIEEVDCIISGLPFSTLPHHTRKCIIQVVHKKIKQDGMFIAFQYSLQMKKTLEEYFPQMEIGWVPFNFPPAFVYICKK